MTGNSFGYESRSRRNGWPRCDRCRRDMTARDLLAMRREGRDAVRCIVCCAKDGPEPEEETPPTTETPTRRVAPYAPDIELP